METKKIKEVIRGVLYKPDSNGKDTNSPIFYAFQFNPSEIEESKSVKYVSNDAPGITFPKTQYLGGGEHEISFTLFITTIPFEDGEDIQGIKRDLDILNLMELPEENSLTPPLLYFSFGSITETVTLRKLDIKYMDFSENLIATSAEVSLTLRVENKTTENERLRKIRLSAGYNRKKAMGFDRTAVDLRYKVEV